MFLPWHRSFLRNFEILLQAVSGNRELAIPYWDWTQDASQPKGRGRIWNADRMGGSGSPVPDGPFSPQAGWRTMSPAGRFPMGELVRDLGFRGRTVTTTPDVLRLYNLSSYDLFRKALEAGPHGNMHVWVGGQMAEVTDSVNDPIFWMHHANIDRIWAQWQEFYPNVPTTAAGMDPGTVMPPSAIGQSSGDTVGSVIKAPYYDAFYPVEVEWSLDASLPNSGDAFGTSGGPAAAVYGDSLFCLRQGQGDSGWIWGASTAGGGWTADAEIQDAHGPVGVSGSPAVASYGGLLYCVHQGQGDSGWTWCTTFDGKGWSRDAPIPNGDNAYGISGRPALAEYDGKLFYVHEGRGDTGWTWCAIRDDAGWSGDALIPDSDNAYGNSGGAALAVYNGRLYCAREGKDDEGYLWCASLDGADWSADARIQGGGAPYGTSGPPALASFGGKLYCVHQGRSLSGWAWCGTFDGANWSADAPLPNPDNAYGLSGSPALVAFDGKLYLIHEGRDDSGWVWFATATPVLPQ